MTIKRTNTSCPPQSDPTRISFRLDPQLAEELARRAKEAGKSPGIYARDLLCDALFHHEEHNQQLAMLRAEVARLTTTLATTLESLRWLPGDLASSVRVLLVHAGSLNRDQARQWVEQTLSHKPNEGVVPCSPSD